MTQKLNRDGLFSLPKNEMVSLLRRFVETPPFPVDPIRADDIRKGLELTVQNLNSLAAR
jgi:hypothetical protein